MRIAVGGIYLAISTELDSDGGTWTFEIIASAARPGTTLFIGMMRGVPWNGAAQVFTEDGKSVDCSPYANGFQIFAKSRARRVWAVNVADE